MVLENLTATHDDSTEALFAFSVIFSCEPDKKHIFSCNSTTHAQQWIAALRQARCLYFCCVLVTFFIMKY